MELMVCSQIPCLLELPVYSFSLEIMDEMYLSECIPAIRLRILGLCLQSTQRNDGGALQKMWK